MANHGTLSTLASGDCIAVVKCGKLSTRLTLRNCFYAPSAVINLLSVEKMISAGFRCHFKDNKVVITALHPNKQVLCKGLMLNNLFFLDIKYLPAPPRHKSQIPCSLHFSKVTILTSSSKHYRQRSSPVSIMFLLMLIFGMHTWDISEKKQQFRY